jgi:hypothetical protein
MRYFLAAASLGLSSWPAEGAAWRLAATGHLDEAGNSYAATFVDTATIEREGDVVRFRTFIVWEENISSADNSRSLTSADCRDRGFQDLQLAYYKGNRLVDGGTPNLRGTAVWESAFYRTIEAVCGRRAWLTKAVKDPYGWAKSAFGKLHTGGYWPLHIGP